MTTNKRSFGRKTIFAAHMKRAMGGRQVGGSELDHESATQAINQLILQERIDELKKLKNAHSINIFDEYLEHRIAQLVRDLPNCEKAGCNHKDTHQGHGSVWWTGYSTARAEVTALLNKAKGE